MTTEQQIKALAELDGWTETFWEQNDYLWGFRAGRSYSEPTPNKCYLTSYDAIIPLIQKQPVALQRMVYREAYSMDRHRGYPHVNESVSSLCEALLRATGRWVE